MPWQETTVVQVREEFVAFAMQEGANRRALCRRYRISAKTGYTWIQRATEESASLADRSRRPTSSPGRTVPEVEAAVVAVRTAHPSWGGRKLHHWLKARRDGPIPAPSTITDILRRHDLLDPDQSQARQAPLRFEHPDPNALWQLDFMGHLAMAQGRLHPMTLLDDHARFSLGIWACGNQHGALVQAHLTACVRRDGLPRSILTDHGPPWGTAGRGGLTVIEAWLIRLGIRVRHGRPYHPQTQGKVERFHRTLATEVTRTQRVRDLAHAHVAFDRWRHTYNHERPHEALGFAVPATRSQPSPFSCPETLPPIEYGPADLVRLVRGQGAISFQHRSLFISRGLIGLPVAVRPTTTDGVFAVFFCHQQVGLLDLTTPSEV